MSGAAPPGASGATEAEAAPAGAAAEPRHPLATIALYSMPAVGVGYMFLLLTLRREIDARG